jgi:hypothetical protein
MTDKNYDRILDLILGQLEKLNENQESLSEEIQKTNIEITKISGLKYAVSNIKDWKEDIEKVANADDISKIKSFYNKHQDINTHIIDIYLILKELRASSDDYRKFKIRAMTIIAVVSFLFTTALALLAIWAKASH